jgi:predicted alpha/beta-hydrolase family hydrolase
MASPPFASFSYRPALAPKVIGQDSQPRRVPTVRITAHLGEDVVIDVPTPSGPARVHLDAVAGSRGLLLLGHGAGGGVGAPDLVAAAAGAREAGFAVGLVEQPYRVAGRRSSPRPPQLDEAWLAVVARLREEGMPLLVGGRSAGARVACRTAAASGAVGVLCLAFPLRPPGRPDAPSRLGELEAAGVPTLVVQGERDPYGIPPAAAGREVVLVPGTHTLRATAPIADAVRGWLAQFRA